MKRFRIRYLPEAKNAAKKLPPEIKPRVRDGIEELLHNPFAGKELVDELSGFRSLPVGKYRVIYRITEYRHLIEIHFIGHRRDVYMNFKEMLETIKR
ncbi:MAG: type II toxin-antitoxin system RelE/ParE family toxin [Deltaproteobacteria bacterium]|nr:type II toxin-antitoxin system RelE/ParE family toxin [Deltaproteobacteria bacterium]